MVESNSMLIDLDNFEELIKYDRFNCVFQVTVLDVRNLVRYVRTPLIGFCVCKTDVIICNKVKIHTIFYVV